MSAIYLENRLIGMLDVLGFSNELEKNELAIVADRYADLIVRAKKQSFSPQAAPGSPAPPSSNFALGEFVFDTLVLVSEQISPKSVGNFVFAVTQLMEMFFEASFPLRGAISIGNYYYNKNSGVFLSDVFKRLNAAGQNQEWCGCMILQEAESAILENLVGSGPHQDPQRADALVRYSVPVKQSAGDSNDHYCLNWPYLLSDSAITTGLQFLAGNEVKHKNTKNFLDFMKNLPDSVQPLPHAFLPATRVKVMKARSGVRMKFEDEAGNGVDPKCSFTVSVTR